MTTSPAPTFPPSRRWLPGAMLGLLVVLAYVRALHGDFLWDDDLHVTKNPTIVGPFGLKEIWTTARANYFPLVLTNFWLQHAAWGLDPLGYHLVTLACHALAAVLLWRVLRGLRVPGAWLGAALWALHPVQVESVAWICELKNTQSAVFFLLSIWFWLQWLRLPAADSAPGKRRHYFFALVCALLALLSKPSTVMLPVALALITWWRHAAPRRRDFVALAPFFALSAAAAGWAVWEQKFHSGAVGAEWNQSFAERLALAGKIIWFYLGKLVWPCPLSFIYPRWAATTRLVDFLPLAAALGGLAALWWRTKRKAAFVAAAYFVAMLFPVLGFFDVYFFRYSFVGDHFQYLAGIGPLALLAAALATMFPRGWPLAGGALVLALAMLTVAQCGDYRSLETLWRATLARNPAATMAWVQLGSELGRTSRHREAIECFQRALAQNPNHPEALNHLGVEYLRAGRRSDAITEFQHAVDARLDFPEAHTNLGLALMQDGRPGEALPHFESAARSWPDIAAAHYNLANGLAALSRAAEALTHYEQAIFLEPGRAETHGDFGRALAAAGRTDDAIARYERAIQLNPALAVAHNDLGTTLAQRGQIPEALAQFDEAVRLDGTNANAHLNRGGALAALDRLPEACDAFARAVQLQPDSAKAHTYLAQLLRALGRESEAREHFDQAARLQNTAAPAR